MPRGAIWSKRLRIDGSPGTRVRVRSVLLTPETVTPVGAKGEPLEGHK